MSLPSKLANTHRFAAQDTAYATASVPPTRRLELSMRRALIMHHVMCSLEPESGPRPGQAKAPCTHFAFDHAHRTLLGSASHAWSTSLSLDGPGGEPKWRSIMGTHVLGAEKTSPGRPAKVLCCCCCCCQQAGIFQVHRLFRLNDNLVDQHGHRSSRRTASAYADALDIEGINGTRA